MARLVIPSEVEESLDLVSKRDVRLPSLSVAKRSKSFLKSGKTEKKRRNQQMQARFPRFKRKDI